MTSTAARPSAPSRVAVVGAGAVGSFYGAMLARAGHAVTLIGRPAHVQAVAARGLQLQMAGRVETVALAASTEIAAARDAELVLFCVKSSDSAAVARELAPHVGRETLVLSLQNGVDNAETIAAEMPRREAVVPVAVYVATALPEPGRVQHHGRGDLVVGPIDVAAAADPWLQQRLQSLVALFAGAGVAVTVSPDVIGELWGKLMVNCAYNAISALAQQPYGRMAALAPVRDLQAAVVREVVAVARAAGHAMDLAAAQAAMTRIADAMPAQFSSTAQDLARGKPTEIEHLNGHVVRRGAELGVPTPANQALYALVKLAEATQAAGPAGG